MCIDNLVVGWIWFLLGGIAGAIYGMHFYKDEWLGGYNSWKRRMIRLAHVAFFGFGIMNILLGLMMHLSGYETGFQIASPLLFIGAIMMPLVCYMAAWRMSFRHLFFIPVLAALTAFVLIVWEVW